jgi:hypothetical protein
VNQAGELASVSMSSTVLTRIDVFFLLTFCTFQLASSFPSLASFYGSKPINKWYQTPLDATLLAFSEAFAADAAH